MYEKVTDDCNFIVKKVSLLSLFEIKNETFKTYLFVSHFVSFC